MASVGDPEPDLALTFTPLTFQTSQSPECTRCRVHACSIGFCLQRRWPLLYSSALQHCRHSAAGTTVLLAPSNQASNPISIQKNRSTVAMLFWIFPRSHSIPLACAQGALQINSWISNRSPLTDATKAVRRGHCCSEDFPPQPTPELAHLTGAVLSSGATRGFVGKGNIQRIPLALHDSVRPKPINAA